MVQSGLTALSMASWWGYTPIVRLLLAHPETQVNAQTQVSMATPWGASENSNQVSTATPQGTINAQTQVSTANPRGTVDTQIR